MSKGLNYFSQHHRKVFEQKILTKGHTQMRVDSVPTCIKTAIGQNSVYNPADYVCMMEEARNQPKPYEVQYLNHTFFKHFISSWTLKSIRPGIKADDPVVVDTEALIYKPKGKTLVQAVLYRPWEINLRETRRIPSNQKCSFPTPHDPTSHRCLKISSQAIHKS
ncbi:hypothetical protein ElyMa_003728100 [Elysia marginata]|uniref:Uncharacterized protein n=1 Tax=Elysia marginata TaxID=1093978 RepID=A0AAV4F4J9_9GAST|nr:hypothetical protein ElyMa_003728100 [Elysia marginata]